MSEVTHSRQRAKIAVGDQLPSLTQRVDEPGWVYFIGHLLITG